MNRIRVNKKAPNHAAPNTREQSLRSWWVMLAILTALLFVGRKWSPSGAKPRPVSPPVVRPTATPPDSARIFTDQVLQRQDTALQHLAARSAGDTWIRNAQAGALPDFCRRSAAYLQSSLQPTGQFVYQIRLDAPGQPSSRYNWLRHAGAIYALCQFAEAYADSSSLAAAHSAADFLKRSTIRTMQIDEQDEPLRQALGVWSERAVTGQRAPSAIKLGGTGLGLIALLSLEKLRPGSTAPDTLHRLGHGLLAMQKADGSFYSKYIPSKGGLSEAWTSLYYPGEAALALTMLYEWNQAPIWREAACKALAYLARQRRSQTIVAADHWALLATQRLLPHLATTSSSYDSLLLHAIQVCGSMLDDVTPLSNPAFPGCFVADGRTTPTATRLEGLLAAATFLPDTLSALHARLDAAAALGIRFLVETQCTQPPHIGAMPRSAAYTLHAPDRRAAEVRIDYVQHALSAVLAYELYRTR